MMVEHDFHIREELLLLHLWESQCTLVSSHTDISKFLLIQTPEHGKDR